MQSSPAILDELISINRNAALEAGAITANVLDAYQQMLELRDSTAIAGILQNLSPQELYQLSRFHLSEQLVTSAVQHQSRFLAYGEAQKQVEQLLDWALSGHNQEQILDRLDGLTTALENLTVSIVSTPHPDVYVTPTGRSFERFLATSIQDILLGQPQIGSYAPELRSVLNNYWHDLANEQTSLTPDTAARKVTVQDENDFDRYYWGRLLPALDFFEDRFIAALDARIGSQQPGSPLREALEAMLDAAENTFATGVTGGTYLEQRTWTRGADADGKDKATAEVLETAFIDEGEALPILDLRQNAVRVHRGTVDDLIRYAFGLDNTARHGHAVRKVFRQVFPQHQTTDRQYLYDAYEALATQDKNRFKAELLKLGLHLEIAEHPFEGSKPVYNEALKRLRVVNQELDQSTRGSVTRHKIANFQGPQDFWDLLLLMHEAGLIEIKNDEVTKAKLDIMPLLETVADLQNGHQTFAELLEDPLIKSFYDARRHYKAWQQDVDVASIAPELTFMCGYSDSAKTSGFFAAAWFLLVAQSELAQLAASHGMDIRMLGGAGQGMVRGGRITPAAINALIAPEIAANAILDVTWQSNYLRDMAGSNLVEPMMAAAITGTLKAATEHPLATADIHSQSGIGQTMSAVAQHAAELYDLMVFKNLDVIRFLESMPTNPLISSRPVKRAGGEGLHSLDEMRAVPVEYSSHPARFPVQHIGLYEAISSTRSEQALAQAWQKGDPAVRALFTMIALDMRNFNQATAEYALNETQAGQGAWDGLNSLTLLQAMLTRIMGRDLAADASDTFSQHAENAALVGQAMRLVAAERVTLNGVEDSDAALLEQAKHHATAATAADYMIAQNTAGATKAMINLIS